MKVLIVGDPQQMAPLLRELITQQGPLPSFGYGFWCKLTEGMEQFNRWFHEQYPRHEFVSIVGFRDLENLVAMVDAKDSSKDIVINPSDFGVAFVTGSLEGDFDGAMVTERIGAKVKIIEMDFNDKMPTSRKAAVVSLKPWVYLALKLRWLTVEELKNASEALQLRMDHLKACYKEPNIALAREAVGEQMKASLHRVGFY